MLTDEQRQDEANWLEIDAVMLYLEDARRRSDRAVKAMRQAGAEEHLVEAVERTQAELSDIARRLRQGTFFAVPDAQLTLK